MRGYKTLVVLFNQVPHIHTCIVCMGALVSLASELGKRAACPTEKEPCQLGNSHPQSFMFRPYDFFNVLLKTEAESVPPSNLPDIGTGWSRWANGVKVRKGERAMTGLSCLLDCILSAYYNRVAQLS